MSPEQPTAPQPEQYETEAAAIMQFYTDRREHMVGYLVRKRGAQRYDAEDAVQTVFANFLTKPWQPPLDALAPYTYSALFNKLTDIHTRSQRDIMDISQDTHGELTDVDPYDELLALAALNSAINRLPSRQQYVARRMLEGKTRGEIEASLNIGKEPTSRLVSLVRKNIRRIANSERWHD